MSEGDVSLIRDEDVLRRMWQQTEDFSRKKEIRAHMYRLREERLRNLYSPEPTAEGKGVESARTHVQSFVDQSFQGIKSKEVRDAASPPKEFHYRGQDLKELSNAGWNVESENKTTDDGHTRVRNVRADIEGRYDVEGGTGQFAAVDKHRQAVTEYHDDNSSLKRNESSTNTAAHEQVVRKTDDGTQMSSTTNSSTSSSKFQQVSTTNVPYVDDYDRDTNRNEFTKVTKTNDYEQSLRSDLQGDLVSRKVDYPDDNTKVIVETRCLPDGTRVTSTRREFRAPVHTRSEQHSSRSESKSSHSTQQRSDVKSSKIVREFDSRNNIVDSQRHADDYDFKRNVIDCSNQTDDYSQSQRTNVQNKRSDVRESKTTRETVDNRTDVVDSRIHQHKDFCIQKDNYSDTTQMNKRYETNVKETDRDVIITDNKKTQQIDHSINKDDYTTQRTNRFETKTDEIDRREILTKNDNQKIHRDVKTHHNKDNEERVHNITRDNKEEVLQRNTSSEQYQTTYQTDFSQKKISNDWSASQQAWASSLRSDTPTSTRPTTRASSPGSRTFQSSTSSLRSSVSPDKTSRKPSSRGGSPSKVDRSSPARSTDRYSSTHSTHSVTETKTNRYTSPDRKPPSAPRPSSSPDRKPDGYRQRPSASPEKRSQDLYRPSASPERKPGYKPTENRTRQSPRPSPSPDRKPIFIPSDDKSTPDSSFPRTTSPYRSTISPDRKIPKDISPTRPSVSPDRKQGYQTPTAGLPSATSEFPRTTSPSRPYPHDSTRPSASPDLKPGYLVSPTRASPERPADKFPKESSIRPSTSPDRKPGYMRPTVATHSTPDSPTKYASPDRRSPTKNVPSLSPDRMTFNKTTNIKEDHYKFIDEETKMYSRTDREHINVTKRTSPSPDRLSGPLEEFPSPLTTGPEDSSDYCRPESPAIRPSLRKGSRSPSPPKGPVTFTEDQFDKSEKFQSTVTDETTKFDTNTDITKQYYRTPKHESSPSYDLPREPSPSKYGTYDKKHRSEETQITTTSKDTKDVKYDSLTRREKTLKTVPDIPSSPTKKSPRDNVSPTKTPSAPRQPSPTKYETYEKKQHTEETEESTTIIKDSKDVKYDSLTRREKTSKTIPASPTKKTSRDSVSPAKTPSSPRQPSPSKYGTYEKKQRTEETEEVTTVTNDSRDLKYDSLTRREKTSPRKVPDVPASPTKKSPRDSISPVKPPTKDAKYKHTTDFISTEKTTEEVNKKTTKDHPRQLVTPSTSPTRKPKSVETAPSTGQSSPTTSVSGFIYFGSPRNEATIVTDLDDVEYYTETDRTDVTTTYKRPETLNVERSPSPSKIPCRSPSPEKRTTPQDSLPRKSSLKKPSSEFPQVSPTEKPPSSFRVSPTDDNKEFPEHKIVKKDRPDKPTDSPAKVKPPFERRETYEDRCRKILGMMQDDKTTVTKDTYVKEPESNQSTPSVSPCLSPEPKEQSPSRGYVVKDTTKVSDFISHEQDDTIKKTTIRHEDVIKTDTQSKAPRDTSPTKLLDIISHKTVSKYDVTTTEDVQDTIQTCRQSPDRDFGYQKPKDQPKVKPTDSSHSRTSPHRSFSPEKKGPEGHPKESPVRPSLSPERKPGSQKPVETRPSPTSEHPRSVPSKPRDTTRSSISPEKPHSPIKSIPVTEPKDKHPKESTPCRSSVSPSRTPGYMRPTATKTSRYEETTTTEDLQENISKTIRQSADKETGYHLTSESRSRDDFPRTTSPSRPKDSPRRPSVSPERKPGYQQPSSPTTSSLEKKPVDNKAPPRASVSPDRKPSYMRATAATTTKYATETTTEDIQDETISRIAETKHPASKLPRSQQTNLSDSATKKPEEPKHPRTQFPNKKVTKVTEDITDFMQSEREQEILERVHQSLRKLSPSRDQKSPSRERSPGKTISLQDLDVTTETIISGETISEDDMEITETQTTTKTGVKRPGQLSDDKPKEQKPSSKPPSRNASPIKKPTTPASKPESPTKSRSISPKKPVSPTERSQSPQVPRASGIKPRDPIPSNLSRRPTPGNTSPTKTEKVTTEVKKTTGVVKQNSFGKTTTTKTTTTHTSKLISPTSRSELEPKRAPTPKGINKENVSPKKEDTKVTRTASDISIKTKKASPQRIKSKPEIQVSDMSTTRTTKTSTTATSSKKSTMKEPQPKLAPKPKSATALNTSTDDDDIIIDVELAKSSRENSPDRICPTPINFNEDIGTPRFPDEVSEPDDEFRRRTYHTIHETESIVDDIVEICEDDELFVKRTNVDETDECLLSVTDKVSKFTNKIDTTGKPKDSTALLRDTERKVHSDFDEKLKSDECLLSVSEKVNKFAKGPRDTKDSRSPSRRIVDEYDTETIYQDDYTKLSVNDKAHLFVETAESSKVTKTKPAQKVERPDLTEVDESLRSDDCLLSVSDKVHKFVKTAEQFLTDNQETEEKDKKVKEQYEQIMKHIVQDDEDEMYETQNVVTEDVINRKTLEEKRPLFTKETASSHTKIKDYASPNLKTTERTPTVKITTLRSSEAVKKAKALFENIASTTTKTKDTKVTKLTDIGVIKKSPKTDSTIVHHPSLEDGFSSTPDVDTEVDAPLTPTTKERPTNGTSTRPHQAGCFDNKPRSSPTGLTTHSPEVPRSKSPMRPTVETTITTKTVLSRYPAARAESPKRARPEPERQDKQAPKQPHGTPPAEPKPLRHEPEKDQPQDKIPSYQRPTKTSQIKDETRTVEEIEVSSRRGSGKFGVELRRTSVERSTVSSERRRSSEHHQPCIEDIFDLDLLEQMLEKVVGYEQRRRIRAQIRVARKRTETTDVSSHTRTKQTTVTQKSPERRPQTKSPERRPKTTPQKTLSPERLPKSTPQKTVPDNDQARQPLLNGHAKEPSNLSEKRQRPQSPEKPRVTLKTKSPVRHPSPEKKTRTVSPSETPAKPKGNRFNEYASAYMKKVGLNETNKLKTDIKTKKTDIDDHKTQLKSKSTEFEDHQTINQFEHQTLETKTSSQSKSFTERASSKDTIEVFKMNGKRSPSPEKKRTPDRHIQSPTERLYQRSPSPDFKRKTNKETIIKTVYESEPIIRKETKETIIKTVYDERPKKDTIKTVFEIEKKASPKQVPEEKPSWVTNRNLKKITSETRTFGHSNKRQEERRYRATTDSPGRAGAGPVATVDAITSSYGPGPLDADGRPLFGIKALRNGASNYQVKGTVIRQEFHSRNGGEPEGSVSVTAYSTEPQDLEKLLQSQGEKPSRIHGLAAITTTKKFGGDTGTTLKDAHGKEERATLEQFTHSDRRVDSRVHHLEDRTQDSRSRIIEDSKSQDFTRSDRIHHAEDRIRTSRVHHLEDKTQEKSNKMHQVEDSRSCRVQHVDSRSQDSSERREDKGREEKVRRTDERRERREDRKTVRQSSVKSLTEKYIKSASDTSRTERSSYPKAGLILRTATMKDSVSSDSSAHAGLGRTDSAHSLASVEDSTVVTRGQPDAHHTSTTTTTTVTNMTTSAGAGRTHERSFLDSSTKVSGVQDILTRMKNADIVIQEGDSAEDAEARALLNKFLGATVLMAGMQSYVTEPAGKVSVTQETVRSTGRTTTSNVEIDLDQCWDERVLRNLLEETTDYEQRRRLRARIRTLMAEQEACASAVTEALGAAGQAPDTPEADVREEEEVTMTSSVRKNSSEKTVSSSTTTKTSKVIESMTRPAPKAVSPFAKFRQLEKQNSTTSPNPASPRTPSSPGTPAQPYFKFTDPALQASALTIKERLLQWCRDKTRDYENVKLENFSTSWADGLAFCALLHHFLPDAFDYSLLTPDKRRHNFTLAFKIADEKAGIYPLLDVDDMVAMRKPDWKCVFTYVQSIHRRFKDQQ